jgi:putative addiction module component (TIGR02574 family)
VRRGGCSCDRPPPGTAVHLAVVTAAAKEIIEAALKLDPSERELLVEELTASLHSGFASLELDQAWAEEIKRRCAELDSGKAVLRDWSEVRDEILAELRERRR